MWCVDPSFMSKSPLWSAAEVARVNLGFLRCESRVARNTSGFDKGAILDIHPPTLRAVRPCALLLLACTRRARRAQRDRSPPRLLATRQEPNADRQDAAGAARARPVASRRRRAGGARKASRGRPHLPDS